MNRAVIKPGLHLFTSNRMEILAGKLAQRLDTPLPSPLTSEIIVVRNKGMERWLKLELASRHGICANYDFPFPEAFGSRVFRELMPAVEERPPVDRNVLVWRVLRVLPELLSLPEFAPLREYLGDRSDPRKALQLAGKIAHLFDQYLVFRPRLVLGWDNPGPTARNGASNGADAWQGLLWRAATRDFPQTHAAYLWKELQEIVSGPNWPATKLPPRISIFGVSAVPPFYLDLFAGLARHLQINLFLLQPSQEYWGEITSPRESERILRRHGAGDQGEEPAAFQLHLESGNRLLASLGYLGRDFLKLVLEAGDWVCDEEFDEPGENTLLHTIQSDILHLRDREGPASAEANAGSAELVADDSIQVHCCHSPLRELEVLYDHMLAWFQQDAGLAPRDIVVMTPEIDTYAPLIQAVFGAPEDKSRFIPFSVADRAGRRQSQVLDTFLRLLELPETRLEASAVLEILETPAVRARFGLEEAQLQLVRSWVEETRIRWGIDGPHREQWQLPGLSGNTWREGLDRLLLGYGMTGTGRGLFQGLLPYDGLEGSQGPLLGRVLDFMDRVFELAKELPKARALDEWITHLQQMIDDFFEITEETLSERQILLDTLEELRRQQRLSRFDRPVDRAEILDWLSRALEEDAQQAGFLTGGVTFCGLKPMRSIPFQVVCLIGMNDGAFPRPARHLSFDLMARQPRLGDRSTREDDRYLFLETLLSARRRLYLSYVGQSVRDNRLAPPSVLVSELLDYIERGFGSAGDNRLADRLVTRHRLQAFSEEYFRPGGRLFSYSQENCQASRSARAARTNVPAFCAQALGEPAAKFREVTLDQLASFLGNPCRFLLIHRLGVVLPEAPAELEDREPFGLDKLEQHWLKQELVGQRLKPGPTDTPEQLRKSIAAAGCLPLGEVGQAEYRRLAAAVEDFLKPVKDCRADPSRPALDIDLILGPFHVSGRIREFTNTGPLYYRCATLKEKDQLRAWVGHLAMNAVAPGCVTTVLAEDRVRQYAPPEHARESLADLLELYWQGLHAPLKFFPATAFAFVQAKRKRAATDPAANFEALKAARRQWEWNERTARPPERADPHIALCFRDTDPLDAEFMALAERIVDPMLDQEIKETP